MVVESVFSIMDPPVLEKQINYGMVVNCIDKLRRAAVDHLQAVSELQVVATRLQAMQEHIGWGHEGIGGEMLDFMK
jgi:hypothetical protein